MVTGRVGVWPPFYFHSLNATAVLQDCGPNTSPGFCLYSLSTNEPVNSLVYMALLANTFRRLSWEPGKINLTITCPSAPATLSVSFLPIFLSYILSRSHPIPLKLCSGPSGLLAVPQMQQPHSGLSTHRPFCLVSSSCSRPPLRHALPLL